MTTLIAQLLLRQKLAEMIDDLAEDGIIRDDHNCIDKLCRELRSGKPLSDNYPRLMAKIGFEDDAYAVIKVEGVYVVVNWDEKGRKK